MVFNPSLPLLVFSSFIPSFSLLFHSNSVFFKEIQNYTFLVINLLIMVGPYIKEWPHDGGDVNDEVSRLGKRCLIHPFPSFLFLPSFFSFIFFHSSLVFPISVTILLHSFFWKSNIISY